MYLEQCDIGRGDAVDAGRLSEGVRTAFFQFGACFGSHPLDGYIVELFRDAPLFECLPGHDQGLLPFEISVVACFDFQLFHGASGYVRSTGQ